VAPNTLASQLFDSAMIPGKLYFKIISFAILMVIFLPFNPQKAQFHVNIDTNLHIEISYENHNLI
jgi:hypothetical protein